MGSNQISHSLKHDIRMQYNNLCAVMHLLVWLFLETIFQFNNVIIHIIALSVMYKQCIGFYEL